MRRTLIGLTLAFVLSLGTTSVAHAATTRFVSPTPTGIDTGDCSNSVSPCATFNFAISKAVAGDTISAAAGTYNETLINVDRDLTITGAGQATTIIDAAGFKGPVISIDSVTTTLSNLTVENESLSNICGGGITNALGTVTLSNVTVRNNTTLALVPGGGICNFLGQMTIQNSLIGGADNTADGNKAFNALGGGIYNDGKLTLDNTVVSANSVESEQGGCAGNGGGIFNDNIFDTESTLTVRNSTISNNIANQGVAAQCIGFLAGNGGGIFNTGILVIDHSLIEANQAASDVSIPSTTGGGGIYNQGGIVTVSNGSTIKGNFAVAGDTTNPASGTRGGGIFHTSFDCGDACPFNPNLTISNSTISDNVSFLDGGGIYRDNPMTLTNITISGNTSVNGEAGAIYNNGAIGGCLLQSCPGTLINVTIANNKALNIGGISADNPKIPTILKNTLIAQNTQTSDNTNANCAPSDTMISSQNHNLSDDDTCTNFFTQTGDIKNQPAGIGPLADNGGNYPSNPPFTHALLTGSQAIDAIPPADCTDSANTPTPITVDERNFPRPGVNVGPNCDIGAFELQAVVPTPTPTPIPTPIPTPTPLPTPIAVPTPVATPIPPVLPQFVEGSGTGCSLNPAATQYGGIFLWGFLYTSFLLQAVLREKKPN